VVGNIINQTVFEKKLCGGGPLDVYRAGSFALYAAILSYIIHNWYLFLNSSSLTKNSPVLRVLVDQLCFCPAATAFFFAFMETVAYLRETVEKHLFK
jgi:hypothetical protein